MNRSRRSMCSWGPTRVCVRPCLAAYDREAAEMRGEPYVLSIEVQDVPGVLNQVRACL